MGRWGRIRKGEVSEVEIKLRGKSIKEVKRWKYFKEKWMINYVKCWLEWVYERNWEMEREGEELENIIKCVYILELFLRVLL